MSPAADVKACNHHPADGPPTHPTAPSAPWDAKGFLPGFTLPPERRSVLHQKLGFELPDMVYTEMVTGHRMLVVPEPVSDRTHSGLLWKPNSEIERQKLMTGAGWVISVGPLVGNGRDTGHPVGVICSHPKNMLGARITFRAYTGTPMKISRETEEFMGELQTLTDRDVQTINWEESV